MSAPPANKAHLHHHGDELVVVDLSVAVAVHLRQNRLNVLAALRAVQLQQQKADDW